MIPTTIEAYFWSDCMKYIIRNPTHILFENDGETRTIFMLLLYMDPSKGSYSKVIIYDKYIATSTAETIQFHQSDVLDETILHTN